MTFENASGGPVPVPATVGEAINTLRLDNLAALHEAILKGLPLEDFAGNGRTLLLEAIDRGNVKAVRLLLQAGASPHQQGRDGFSPLIRAVMASAEGAASGGGPIVQILLQAGADPLLPDPSGRNAYDIAAAGENSWLKTIMKGRREAVVARETAIEQKRLTLRRKRENLRASVGPLL